MEQDNEQLLKKVIAEKDKVKLKYKQKLNAIKQHYGVEFDVDHFKTEKVKSIKFINLKYKKGYDNLSVIYDGISMKANSIEYDYTDSRIIKNSNHRRFIPNLEKDFKLKLIVNEIDRANGEYRKEINEIDTKYQLIKENANSPEKVLQIDKDDEN